MSDTINTGTVISYFESRRQTLLDEISRRQAVLEEIEAILDKLGDGRSAFHYRRKRLPPVEAPPDPERLPLAERAPVMAGDGT